MAKDYKDFPRREMLETVNAFDPSELDGPVDEAIEVFQHAKALAAENGWYKVYIDVDWHYEDCTVYIRAWRMETDAEYEARYEGEKLRLAKKKERQQKAAENAAKKLAKTEAEERKLYAALKAKFGE